MPKLPTSSPTPVITPVPTPVQIQDLPSSQVPTTDPTTPETPTQTSDSPATSNSHISSEDDSTDSAWEYNSNWIFQNSWLSHLFYKSEKQNYWSNNQSPISPKENYRNDIPQTDDQQDNVTSSTDTLNVPPSILWIIVALSALPMLFPFKGNILFQSKRNTWSTRKTRNVTNIPS